MFVLQLCSELSVINCDKFIDRTVYTHEAYVTRQLSLEIGAKVAHVWWYIRQPQSLKYLSLIITVNARRHQNINTLHLALVKPLFRLHNEWDEDCVSQLEAIC